MQITSDNEEETQFNFNRTESATGPDEQLSNNNITEYTDDIFDQVIEVTEIPNLSAQDSEVHDDNGTNPDNNHIEAFLENEIRMIDLVYETLLTQRENEETLFPNFSLLTSVIGILFIILKALKDSILPEVDR